MNIHVGFYCYWSDKEKSFECDTSLLSYLVGPFSHVVLCTEAVYTGIKDREKDRAYFKLVNISRKSVKVQFAVKKMRRYGYSYMRLQISPAKYALLLDKIGAIVSSPTYFDKKLMWGLKASKRPTLLQGGWFCSQLIGFLLQEIGIISSKVNCSKISATDLYFLIRHFGGVGCSCPYRYPIAKKDIDETNADTIYLKMTGSPSIPIMTPHDLHMFE